MGNNFIEVNNQLKGANSVIANIEQKHGFNLKTLTAQWNLMYRSNDKLQQCSPASITQAILNLANMGLLPNGFGGQAYVIPYWSSKEKRYVAQVQLGYKGLIKLAYDCGAVKLVRCLTIYSNERFNISFINNKEVIEYTPTIFGDKGEPIGFVAIVTLSNGEHIIEKMSVKDVEKHRDKYSLTDEWVNGKKTGGKTIPEVWKNNFEAMARKTVLIKALKLVPDSNLQGAESIEFQHLNNNYIDVKSEIVNEEETLTIEQSQAFNELQKIAVKGELEELQADERFSELTTEEQEILFNLCKELG